MTENDHDIDQACSYSANGSELPQEERHHRRRLRKQIQDWANENGASCSSYAEAEQKCGFFLGGIVISAIISWLIWRFLNRFFPEQPEPAKDW